MISKYFSYDETFASLIDPVFEKWGDRWYLKTLPNQIYTQYDNIFNNNELENIINTGIRFGLKNATVSGNLQDISHIRRSKTSFLTPNSMTSWVYERMTAHVNYLNEKYWNYDLDYIENMQFTYYNSKENGCYVKHLDGESHNLPVRRKLSLITQLSDPCMYEGGEILLHVSNNPIRIPKKRGLVISFPSHILHEVTPVTSGERYSLVSWVHGSLLR